MTLPAAATQMPARAGPPIAANCHAELPQVAALANSSGGTVSGMSVEEAGSLSARTMPMTKRTAKMSRIGPLVHDKSARPTGADHEDGLGYHQDAPPVVLVGEVAGRERKQDDRGDLHEPHHAQGEGGMGAQPELPGDGEAEHLRTEAAEKTPDNEEAKIANSQNGIRVVPLSRGLVADLRFPQTLKAEGQMSASRHSPQRGRLAMHTARPCSISR